MKNFNIVQRAGANFPGLISQATSFAFTHKNPESLKPALLHVITQSLSSETDQALFSAASKLCADVVVSSGQTIRDTLIDAIAKIIAIDAAAFAGKAINISEPLRNNSQYRVITKSSEDDAGSRPAVQGKTAEEMAALLAEQGDDGCAGGACKI